MTQKLRFKKDHVFKIMRQQELPYWEIYGPDGSTPAMASDDVNDLEGNIADLRDVLSGIEGAACHIRICNNPFPLGKGQPRGQKLHEFDVILSTERNRSSQEAAPNNPVAGVANNNTALLEKIKDLEVKIVKLEHKHEADLLRKEFEDFKKEQQDASPLGNLIEKLEPYLPALLGMSVTPPPGINGTEEDKKQMLLSAIKDLKSVDANFEQNLTNIAKLAKAKPTEYLQYMQLLAAQANNF